MSNKVKVAPSNKRATDQRKAALDQGIAIKWDGREYAVRLGDLSSLDSAALRREVGLSFIGVLKALRSDPDIDLIAAIVWLRRRLDGDLALEYAEVAAQIDYDTAIDIDEAAPETDPEA